MSRAAANTTTSATRPAAQPAPGVSGLSAAISHGGLMAGIVPHFAEA